MHLPNKSVQLWYLNQHLRPQLSISPAGDYIFNYFLFLLTEKNYFSKLISYFNFKKNFIIQQLTLLLLQTWHVLFIPPLDLNFHKNLMQVTKKPNNFITREHNFNTDLRWYVTNIAHLHINRPLIDKQLLRRFFPSLHYVLILILVLFF